MTVSNAGVPPRPNTLRLLWPQWQGATAANIAVLVPELAEGPARRGYAVGTTVLQAVLPPASDADTVVVPVTMGLEGTMEEDGVESKDAVVRQLAAALQILAERDPARVVTIGGECSVSVGPFSAMAARYPDDIAVVWIDSHPDVGTPTSEYRGYHAMAVATLAGHGDKQVQDLLPATVPGTRIALAGLHSWTEDDFPNVAAWNITTFSPNDLRTSSSELIEWLRSTGCSKVAIHLDVDVVDSNEVVLGLGKEPEGLTTTQVRRLVSDISGTADVVALTVAEYIPRQVIAVRQLLDGLPLI